MRRLLVGLFACGLAAASLVGDAAACMNAVTLSKPQAARLIARAEKALADGNARQALSLLNEQLIDGYELSDPKLEARLERIWAVAKMRTGDGSEVGDALTTIKHQSGETPEDPYLRARLAEVLSRTKDGDKKARELLEALAQKDLLVDAEGYAVLARLRERGGDAAGASQALARCKTMARRAAMCSDPLWASPAARPGRPRPAKRSLSGAELFQ